MSVSIKFEGKADKGDIKRSRWQMDKDFRSWTRQELAKMCRSAFDAANKRINRLEASGLSSPALHSVMNSGGKFYVRGLNLKQLQHDYARCINFLNMQTSSVTGARSYKKTLEQKFGHPLTNAQHKRIFEAFRTVEKIMPAGVQAYGSDRLIQYLADEITSEDEAIMEGVGSQDWEAMIDKTVNKLEDEYEAKMEEFYNTFRDMFSM